MSDEKYLLCDLDTFAGYDEWMQNEVRREVARETRKSVFHPGIWSKRQGRIILERLESGGRIPRFYRS